MQKQEALVNFSAILNRGISSADEANAYFIDKKHAALVDAFKKMLTSHAHLIGNPSIQILQGLNDRGVDVLVTFANKCKVGVQIKTHFDVTEDDFSMKVRVDEYLEIFNT